MLNQGDIVPYKLPMSASPIDPNKLWRGRVLRYSSNSVLVEILDAGYEGLTEWVNRNYVVEEERNNTKCSQTSSVYLL